LHSRQAKEAIKNLGKRNRARSESDHYEDSRRSYSDGSSSQHSSSYREYENQKKGLRNKRNNKVDLKRDKKHEY